MKPTDKEYIEALAKEIISDKQGSYHDNQEKIKLISKGYQLALEHTNHAELVEAAEILCNAILSCGLKNESILSKACFLEEKLIKSKTSKL